MSLKKIFKARIGLKLSLLYAVLFLASTAVTGAGLYYLLNRALMSHDKEIIQSSLAEITVSYKENGIDGIKKALSVRKKGVNSSDLLIRLTDPQGVALFWHFPEGDEEDFKQAELEQSLGASPKSDAFTRIYSKTDTEDAIEVWSEVLENGERLQVGKDTESREATLAEFRMALFLLVVPGAVVGLLTGLFFSQKALQPIRHFVKTIRQIQAGETNARVPLRHNGDELDDLAVLFNQMLDKNTKLMQAMHESLDVVAHDLRTPMTRLMGLAERGIQSQDVAVKSEALAESLESSQQILEMLNTIMDVSEASSGALQLAKKPLNIKGILEEVAEVYSTLADERRIQIQTDAMNEVFHADIRIQQAIANLVDNAVKFSHDEGEVRISGRHLASEMHIEIRDFGVGIAPTEQSKIWERLYRGDSSRSTRGMGLGLSLVKSIVEAHGGQVEVESQLGQGATFRMRLPSEAKF